MQGNYSPHLPEFLPTGGIIVEAFLVEGGWLGKVGMPKRKA
jgi:hypothetical protein